MILNTHIIKQKKYNKMEEIIKKITEIRDEQRALQAEILLNKKRIQNIEKMLDKRDKNTYNNIDNLNYYTQGTTITTKEEVI